MAGTTVLNWNRQSFALLVRDPQLLVMLAKAGGIKLALVSGHAPTAKAPEDVRQAWWDLLASALWRVPATYAPLLMLDANARFSPPDSSSPSSMDSRPDGPNAESLQALCGDFGLCPSAQFDPAGRPLVSWVSRQGRESLIDYFVCPNQWASAMRVEQCPSLDDLHATIDHRPLRLCLDLTLDSISPSCRRRIDVRALHTAEGLSAVEHALRTMPLIPWGVDSTTHVALLHTHLRGSLAASLPVLKSRPRNPAYSEATIDLVRAKRRTRKRVRELYAQERALILEAAFAGWAQLTEPAPAVTTPVLSECRRHRTRVLASLHFQEGLLRTKMKADKAAFLREEMQQARDLGSAHFAHRIRSVLRTGRKFKAPALLPTLFPHTGAEAAGQEAVMHAMGTHYALAERASESTTTAHLSRRCEAPTCPLDAMLVAQDMPSLPALARSIAGIQCRKAGGISGIPPDVYRLAPHLSAIALFPIYSKLVAQGFRVRAHFMALRHRGMCGGVLFLDCKSAYYSVVRDLLTLPAGCLADPQSLYSRACQLFQSEAARQRFVNDMWLGGALQQNETDTCLCRFVRAQTSGAWFTTDATGCTLWATQSGTAPGSPIADALFAIVYASFLTDVQSRLHAQGCTSVEVCGNGDSAVPTWADDTAILFGVRSAAEVLPALGQVASVACNGMQRLGLTPNFGPGKTEAVLLLQGFGSKRLKQQELCSETPGIFFTDCQGDRRFVRIVTAYTHLGTVLRADGHEIPNIRHRAGLMRKTLGPLRSKIFSNPFVTAAEKRLLFEQRVLPKFLYGAGLWRLSTMHEEQAALEPIRMAMRGSFRALTGFSAAKPSVLRRSLRSSTFLLLRSCWRLRESGHCVRWLRYMLNLPGLPSVRMGIGSHR